MRGRVIGQLKPLSLPGRSMSRRLFTHISYYAVSNLLTTIAGFISFPLFTRIFSVSDYGLMSIVATTLSLVVAVSKMGFQHSIVRFQAETRAGKNGYSLLTFRSTVVVALGLMGAGATVIWVGATELLPEEIWHDPAVVVMLRLAAALVFFRLVESAFLNLLMAAQRSQLIATYQVSKKYLGLAIIIPIALYVVPGAKGFYTGTLVAEILLISALAVHCQRLDPISPTAFDRNLFKTMMVYGAPMVGYEVGGILLNVGDRYVIQDLMGNDAVGLYAASYNVCEYVQTILLVSIGQAVTPAYTRIWEEKGEKATVEFISNVFHAYVIFGALMVAGMATVGHDMVVLLASDKFEAGASVIPLTTLGLVVSTCMPLLAAGVFINKKTSNIVVLVLASAAANIALNYALIPHMGLNGSALSTVLSYLLLSGSACLAGRRYLKVPLPWAAAIKFSAIAYACYWVVSLLPAQPDHALGRIILKGFCLLGAYVLLVLLSDTMAREKAKDAMQRFRPKKISPTSGRQ
jgi:O-antigen/teichoic acid export membrane protein